MFYTEGCMSMKEIYEAKYEELKNIVDELIIVKEDGSVYPRDGVTSQQLQYAIQQVEKINTEIEKNKKLKVELKKKLKTHDENIKKLCDESREAATFLVEKFGRDYLSSWFLDCLGI